MPAVTLWLPLVWLVATVTLVPTLEASPSPGELKLLRHPTLLVPPHPASGPPGDVGAPILPAPTPHAHPEDLPGSDAPLKPTDLPSLEVLEGAPQELGATANSSMAAPAPSTTEKPPSTTGGPLNTTERPPSTTGGHLSTTEAPPSTPGTSAPPCPGDEEPSEACGAPTEEQRAAVAEALGTFTLRFYQHMAETAQPDANLLFSPINVAMGLSHLLLGARGETHERLAAVLAHPPGLACPHAALRQLASAPGLFSAAQIFHHPGLSLRPRFLNESWHFYGARPRALSGNESLDLLRVNAWVREASQGLLPALLPVLPSQPRLLLLSAVHLQAAWRTPLEAKQTVPLPFLRPGRPPRLVPTMTSKKYPVASFFDPRLQVQVGRLELSGGLSLVVLVPQGPLEALGALERALDPPTFLGLLRRAAHTPLRATALALPRLRLDLALDVVALVHDMDYGLFLDAELCGLARGPAVAVDAARHRAVLALDEAGVEAAGAMATSVARTALLLEALRPFLFVLWHDAGAVPLFMGRLSDPQP
ncbi:plasma protease C1 inhibitor [Athene noctua]|uniref:plasma protease C1 inhibitor n=1 Tax=Athene noctua TaxID=126797 RepID=UPI003EB78B02